MLRSFFANRMCKLRGQIYIFACLRDFLRLLESSKARSFFSSRLMTFSLGLKLLWLSLDALKRMAKSEGTPLCHGGEMLLLQQPLCPYVVNTLLLTNRNPCCEASPDWKAEFSLCRLFPPHRFLATWKISSRKWQNCSLKWFVRGGSDEEHEPDAKAILRGSVWKSRCSFSRNTRSSLKGKKKRSRNCLNIREPINYFIQRMDGVSPNCPLGNTKSGLIHICWNLRLEGAVFLGLSSRCCHWCKDEQKFAVMSIRSWTWYLRCMARHRFPKFRQRRKSVKTRPLEHSFSVKAVWQYHLYCSY